MKVYMVSLLHRAAINIMSASAAQGGHNYFDRLKKQRKKKQDKTRMWADAQRDDRPAQYRWRPLFNTAKFG